jgi:hypothetical protein
VLPKGWYLTASATPTTVSETAEGLTLLEFWNGSPEPTDVLIKGKRRATAEKNQ